MRSTSAYNSTAPSLTIISEPQILHCETLSFTGKAGVVVFGKGLGPPNVSIVLMATHHYSRKMRLR